MTPTQEAQRLLQLHNQNPAAVLEVLERQLNTLNGRSDILMSVAGIVITVTGFSGRLIAATSLAAQVFIVAGLVAVVASVAWVLFKVSRIRWLTSEFEGEPEAALAKIIERRNQRTRAFVAGGSILCAGVAMYSISIAIMLLNPGPMSLPVR